MTDLQARTLKDVYAHDFAIQCMYEGRHKPTTDALKEVEKIQIQKDAVNGFVKLIEDYCQNFVYSWEGGISDVQIEKLKNKFLESLDIPKVTSEKLPVMARVTFYDSAGKVVQWLAVNRIGSKHNGEFPFFKKLVDRSNTYLKSVFSEKGKNER